MPRASFYYSHRPRDGFQTLVYSVWVAGVFHLAWINVSLDWLRNEASLNDLKNLAIAQILKD